MSYDWFGNVRELENCIERAVILADDDGIHARHLHLSSHAPPDAVSDPWEGIDLSGTLAEASQRVLVETERRKLETALRDTGGNQGAAADLLQISPRALAAKLKEYRLVTS